jgi:hypothetical protein
MNLAKKTVLAGALVASTLAGGALGAALLTGSANAADSTPSTTAPSGSASGSGSGSSTAPAFDPTKGGHTANGITETLLTGDAATKAKAAALAAVPGGTIERVENDAEGAAYEAHMTKSDGTQVTVKMDSSFKVTGVETGPNGPAGGQPGQAPSGGTGSSGSSGTSSTTSGTGA